MGSRYNIFRRLFLIVIVLTILTPKALLASCCCERNRSESAKKTPSCCARKKAALPKCCETRRAKRAVTTESLDRVCSCEKTTAEGIPAVVRVDRSAAELFASALVPVSESLGEVPAGPTFQVPERWLSAAPPPPLRVLECCWRE